MTTLASRAQLRASFIRWALFIVPAVVLLGFLSGQLAGSGEGDPWFAALQKPDYYPDPGLFPIVWSILYVMMGLAFALVCSAWGAKGRGTAIVAFVIQLHSHSVEGELHTAPEHAPGEAATPTSS